MAQGRATVPAPTPARHEDSDREWQGTRHKARNKQMKQQ
ncbi:hypothetical protein IKG_06139 [Bacillus cereus VD200]|nr:hypothetical protein IKG_06139 [Bacillus cereus VD200]